MILVLQRFPGRHSALAVAGGLLGYQAGAPNTRTFGNRVLA